MLRQLLVPLDGSELAEVILPYVATVAGLTGAEVTVYQAVESIDQFIDDAFGLRQMVEMITPAAGHAEPTPTIADLERHATERAQSYLVTIAQRLSHAGLTVHTRVGHGPPAEQIVDAAREYDLVAMATHGRGGLGRWVYGSVADRVLQAAAAPVLLVRARPGQVAVAAPPGRLVVPLDGSELAEVALPLAIDLASRAGATIILTQSVFWAQMAVGDYPYGYGYSAGLASPGLIEEAEAAVREYLTGVGQRLAGAGVTAEVDLRYTPAADAILTCAAERQADLIVMSTHGRGGVGRWMLGSVADRVLRSATLPVLLVRAGSPPTTLPAAGAPQPTPPDA